MMPSPARIVIIGGGVVGLALFRKFALGGFAPLLCEAGADILSGASKANSAILHTGFDAPPDSLELACIKDGYREYLAIHEKLNLPILKSGALLVAWNEAELEKLPDLAAQAERNGIADIAWMEQNELRQREPHLSKSAIAALHIPGEYIIDPWSTPLAYAQQGILHGGEIRRSCKVMGGDFANGKWRLDTSLGKIEADWVINAAGLYGDIVEQIVRSPSPFTIKPRKGQFAIFDKGASGLLQSILLPVPNDRTKGIVLCRTIFGNLLVGPTAEEQEDREDVSTDPKTINYLVAKGRELLPELSQFEQTALYAGIRPATEKKEYRIEILPKDQWISVNGIRSTGLSAALGIANHVATLWRHETGTWKEEAAHFPLMPNLSQYHPRPYQGDAGNDIVCHCEWVTKEEIENAMKGTLPALDLKGVKRRTRAMMGRCQGFYCAAKIEHMLRQRS